MTSPLDAALTYAALVWQVLPLHSPRGSGCSCSASDCSKPGKHPRTKHGVKEASVDKATIEGWWRKWPDANIGIATGAASGFWVLDQDGEEGAATVARLERQRGELPPTPTARTGGGGLHRLFQYVPDMKNAVRFAPGLDVRTDGGFIVAPPSRHASGRLYEWITQPNESPVADAPHWLLDLIPKKVSRTRQRAVKSSAGANGVSAYARKALEEEVKRVLTSTPNENRNNNLNLAAFSLGQLIAGGVLSHAEVERQLLEAAFAVGLSETEVRGTIGSGLSAGMKAPRAPEAKRKLNGPIPVERPGELVEAPKSRLSKRAGAGRFTPNEEKPGEQSEMTRVALNERPIIRISADLKGMTNAAERALLDAGCPLYQRAFRLARVVSDSGRRRGIINPEGAALIKEVPTGHLRELMSASAVWLKLDRRSGEWRESLPPDPVLEALRDRGQWRFPRIEGVIESPIMRPDGSVLEARGYDEATALLHVPVHEYPPIPKNPSRDDARRAAAEILEVFSEFQFADQRYRAATLAAPLSIAGRHSFAGPCPLFGISSHQRGEGKGLLARCVTKIATGRAPAMMFPPESDAEMRKRLLATAMQASRVSVIDNCEKPLGFASLSSTLTTEEIEDRELGFNRIARLPFRTVLFATGCNLLYRGDTFRRVVPINLDAGVECPEQRRFLRPDLMAHVGTEHPRLHVACLIVLRAFSLAGRPGHGSTPFGSFEAWDATIRAAVIWTIDIDPCEGRKELREEQDVDLERMRAVFEAWRSAFPDNEFRLLSEIVARAESDTDLRDALAALDHKGDPTRPSPNVIGYALRAWKGRIIDGLRLEASKDKIKGKVPWRVTVRPSHVS